MDSISSLKRAAAIVLPARLRDALRNMRFIRRQRLWKRLRISVTLPSKIEIRVQSSPDWVAFSEIFVLGEYDYALQQLLANNERTPLVLDLGANVGYFTLRVLDFWFKNRGAHATLDIIAVEGSPSTFRLLRERLAQPQAEPHVRCYSGLVGRRSGVDRLDERSDHITTSVNRKSRSAIVVPYIDVESIVPSGRRIALIKCDIEGSEGDFLEHYPSLLSRTDNVVIEVHSNVCDVDRCHDILRHAGFTEQRSIKDVRGLTVDLFSRRRPGDLLP